MIVAVDVYGQQIDAISDSQAFEDPVEAVLTCPSDVGAVRGDARMSADGSNEVLMLLRVPFDQDRTPVLVVPGISQVLLRCFPSHAPNSTHRRLLVPMRRNISAIIPSSPHWEVTFRAKWERSEDGDGVVKVARRIHKAAWNVDENVAAKGPGGALPCRHCVDATSCPRVLNWRVTRPRFPPAASRRCAAADQASRCMGRLESVALCLSEEPIPGTGAPVAPAPAPQGTSASPYAWSVWEQAILTAFRSGVPARFLKQREIRATMVFERTSHLSERIGSAVEAFGEERARRVLKEDAIGRPGS